MVLLVLAFAIGFVLVIFGGALINDNADEFLGHLLCLFGGVILGILVFITAPITLHTGSPTSSINAGEH